MDRGFTTASFQNSITLQQVLAVRRAEPRREYELTSPVCNGQAARSMVGGWFDGFSFSYARRSPALIANRGPPALAISALNGEHIGKSSKSYVGPESASFACSIIVASTRTLLAATSLPPCLPTTCGHAELSAGFAQIPRRTALVLVLPAITLVLLITSVGHSRRAVKISRPAIHQTIQTTDKTAFILVATQILERQHPSSVLSTFSVMATGANRG